MEQMGAFLPLILIFVVFYILLIRPQQKKVKLHREMVNNLKRGLKNINWSRSNPKWEGRLLLNGRMLKNAIGIELAANTILKQCDIELSEDRLNYENKLWVNQFLIKEN